MVDVSRGLSCHRQLTFQPNAAGGSNAGFYVVLRYGPRVVLPKAPRPAINGTPPPAHRVYSGMRDIKGLHPLSQCQPWSGERIQCAPQGPANTRNPRIYHRDDPMSRRIGGATTRPVRAEIM
jgi:hypothetical protein